MTPMQSKLVELDLKKKEIKQYYEDLAVVTEALRKEMGIDAMFQGPDGIVYQITEPEGKWVTFEKTSYIRTKRPDEARGDLSVKKAEEAGFKVPK